MAQRYNLESLENGLVQCVFCVTADNDRMLVLQEQVNKTYMESHKLDLMAEVAELRLRLQTVENERSEYKDRYEGLQVNSQCICYIFMYLY